MGAVAPMLSLGACTRTESASRAHRRRAHCGSRALLSGIPEPWISTSLHEWCRPVHTALMTSTPTPNIRLTITVTPEVHATFSRLASVSGDSLSKTMGEWLGATVEGAELMAAQIERAKAAPQVVLRELATMRQDLADDTAALVERLRKRSEPAPAGQARAARSGPARVVPPSGNTGGKGRGAGEGKAGG